MTNYFIDGHAGPLGRADAQETAGPPVADLGFRYGRIRKRRKWKQPAKVRRNRHQRRRVPVDDGLELGKSRVVRSDELAADDRGRRRRRRERQQMTQRQRPCYISRRKLTDGRIRVFYRKGLIVS